MKKIESKLFLDWESAFALIKGCLCLTKGHLVNLKGQVEVESPLIGSCF